VPDSARIPFGILDGQRWQKAPQPFCIGACPPSTRASPAPPSEPFRVPRTAQPVEPVRRCARPPPQPPTPYTHSRAHSRSRAPQVEPPPRARGVPCAPAQAVPLPRAVPRRGARPWSLRPASAARSQSRRGDSGRFEFTTARPVPNLPPPGSQRHVTTGAAEGQSPARRPRPWGWGGPGHPLYASTRAAGREGPNSVAMAATRSEFSRQAGAQVSRPFVPAEDARPRATAWPACGHWVCNARPGLLQAGSRSGDQIGRLLSLDCRARAFFPGRACCCRATAHPGRSAHASALWTPGDSGAPGVRKRPERVNLGRPPSPKLRSGVAGPAVAAGQAWGHGRDARLRTWVISLGNAQQPVWRL
jgi:hypothetical protein